MRVLVLGGAGYIGSFAVRALIAKKHQVTVLDSLEHGHKEHVHKKAKLIARPIQDAKALAKAMRGQDAVMYFAGYIDVAESMRDPGKYYENNLAAGISVLDAMAKAKVRKIIFSSTAAVYGIPRKTPITESHPQKPINHYGASKLMFEHALQAATHMGIDSTIFRYFNVAGAASDASLGEAHEPETHLIPNILKAAKAGTPVKVFGTNFPTKDGTCVRDYVHVEDLAQAHVMALTRTPKGSQVFNLGNQRGYSVREVIAACEAASGKRIAIDFCPPRAGDPPALVASSAKIRKAWGWKPKHDLDKIVRTAWAWHHA